MDINNRVSPASVQPQVSTAVGKGGKEAAKSAAVPAETVAVPTSVSLPEKAKIEVPEFEPRDLQKAMDDLQRFVDDLGRNLNFSIDESTDRTVISVRDAKTQELVRQIPGEEVIAMSRQIADRLAEWKQGLFIDSRI